MFHSFFNSLARSRYFIIIIIIIIIITTTTATQLANAGVKISRVSSHIQDSSQYSGQS